MRVSVTFHEIVPSGPAWPVVRGVPDAEAVPRISQFYGIVITMYYRDHNPPHLHARYAGQEAKVAIDSAEMFEGDLPGRAYRLVREWTELHRAELEANWEHARANEPLDTIDPLP